MRNKPQLFSWVPWWGIFWLWVLEFAQWTSQHWGEELGSLPLLFLHSWHSRSFFWSSFHKLRLKLVHSKSLCFDEKIFFLNCLTSMFFKNVSFWQLHEKVQILKEQFIVEPWDQKKWISDSIYNQNYCVSDEKFFLKLFLKNQKYHDFFVQKKWKSKANGYEKVQILKERLIVEPWDQKKWLPRSIYNQNHCVSAKKNFFF